MGRALRLAALMSAAVLFAATWRSDVAAQSADVDDSALSTSSTPEPVTESAIQPAPDFETQRKDPFEPYGIGPIEEAVPYEQLSAEEQAVADRGADTAGWSGVHAGFGAAVAERSKRARAEAAQHQLGVDALDTAGVIP